MAQIMEPTSQAQRIPELSEIVLDRGMGHVTACLCCKYQIIVILPRLPCRQPPFCLTALLLFQHGTDARRERNDSVLAVLRCQKEIFLAPSGFL